MIASAVGDPHVEGATGQTETMRLEIYVRPGASKAAVGGDFDGLLVVRVVEPADAGRATEAALRSVAAALDLPRRSVQLLRGATTRRKLLEIQAAPAEAERVRRATDSLRGSLQN